MAQVFDRVKVATGTTGTGNITLGAAESGYRTFAQAGATDGTVVNYIIEDGTNWEIGTGQLGGGGTVLSRTVLQSSNANAAIALSGSARVFSGLTKADIDGKANVGHTHSYLPLAGGGLTGDLTLGDGKWLWMSYQGTGHAISINPAPGDGVDFFDRTAGTFAPIRSGSLTVTGTASISGAISVGGSTTMSGSVIVRDTSGTATAMNRWVSFQDQTGVERGWVGFGRGNTWLDIRNNIGGVLINGRDLGTEMDGKAATGHSHTAITVPDTRNANDQPSGKLGYALSVDFKTAANAGTPPVVASTGYAHILTMAGWDTNGGSGGWPTQVSFGDGLAVRQATSATVWGPWRKVWHDGNLNPASYLPLTGGTISSTLAINGLATLSRGIRPGQVGSDSGVVDEAYTFGYQRAGAWQGPYPDLVLNYYTGMVFGASPSYGGFRFYNNWVGAGGEQVIFSVGDGDTNVRAANDLIAGGAVAAGSAGFKQTTYTANARNPIWRFGNADGFGMSYFQGGAGYSSNDTIGFHFGNATADGSVLQLNQSGPEVRINGNVELRGGRNQIISQYDPTQTQGIWSMGGAYKLQNYASNDYGNHYGLCWSYEPGYGAAGNNPQSKVGLSHQMLLQHAGVTRTAIGNGIWTAGFIYANGNMTQPLRPHKLYRRDDSASDFSVQTHWTGTHWWLRGYNGDGFHAECRVAYADSAAALQGYTPDVGTGGSSVAVRTSAGYLNAVYYNQSSAQNENPGIGQFFVETGSDGYLRKASIAHVAGQLGSQNWTFLGTNSFRNVTQFNCLTNGNTSSGLNPPLQVFSDSGSGYGAFMSFHRGGSYAVNMGLDSDNVFRIGGWSASANRLQLDMSGNLTVAGDLTAYSDARLKTNIRTIGGALDIIDRLRGVRFAKDGRENLGVIAQEVQAVLPELVHESNDGTLGVALPNLIGVLIEAIKDLRAEVEELKAR